MWWRALEPIIVLLDTLSCCLDMLLDMLSCSWTFYLANIKANYQSEAMRRLPLHRLMICFVSENQESYFVLNSWYKLFLGRIVAETFVFVLRFSQRFQEFFHFLVFAYVWDLLFSLLNIQ